MPTLRTMLFDDHAMVLEQVAGRLRQENDIEVCQTSGLVNVVESTRAVRPDVVVIDPQNKDGYNYDLLFLVRQSQPETKIIILTAIADTSMRMVLQRIGISDVLEKGVDTEKLLDAIRRPSGQGAKRSSSE
ncbi:MAG: response regulator transcription factor [Chloroflexi bacterium]|nr:response regulator transcription factor [Chloroflexota bacterium]